MPKILIVDDNDSLRVILAKQLTACGIVKIADTASDGAEAVEKATNGAEKYTIIFLDLRMPGMDGFEAAKKIREFEKANNLLPVPIIAVTSFEDRLDESIAAGMDGYLVKPVKLEKLKQIVLAFAHIRPDLENELRPFREFY